MEILEDPMRELYEASLNGCVSTLNTLIQKDPLILTRLSLSPFTETPLHKASLLGHLEFCQILLDKSPILATELDSEGRCPLHLASAKGHTDVVKALLVTNPEMCLVRDIDEMLPLHFAAMRGRVGAIEELIKAKPDSICEMTKTDDGSVLHLCVRYNHLEALKLLVESLRSDHDQFLSLKDKEDNTFLRLALKGRQTKIVKYLLSLSEMSTEIDNMKKEGLISMEMLERYCPRDFMRQHIVTENEVIAAQEGAVTSTTLVSNQQTTLSTSSSSVTNNIINDREPAQASVQPAVKSTLVNNQETSTQSTNRQQTTSSETQSVTIELVQQQHIDPPQSQNITSSEQLQQQGGHDRWIKLERFCKTYLLDQGNWIDIKTREQLMVAATVIATMTFQSVISPPGGVWQGDTTQDGFTCPDYGFCEAGTAVVGYAWSPDFLKFIFLNSASFFSSLCVMLVLMSGFPLENKVVMWILAILMIVAASCMLLTYMWALGLVSPNHIYYKIQKLGYLLVGTWAFLLGLVGLVQITRIVFWFRARRNRKFTTNVALSRNSPAT